MSAAPFLPQPDTLGASVALKMAVIYLAAGRTPQEVRERADGHTGILAAATEMDGLGGQGVTAEDCRKALGWPEESPGGAA